MTLPHILIRRVSQFVELIRNIIRAFIFADCRTIFLNAIDLYDCEVNYNKFVSFSYSVKCCMIRFSSNVN